MNIDDILERIIISIMKVLNRPISEKTTQNLVQFTKFCIVGISNVLISYAIYLVTLLTLEHYGLFSDIDYIISQTVSFILSVLWSFLWNYRYVFEKDLNQKWYAALAKTYASYAFTGLFLSNALLYLFVDVLNMSKILAPMITIMINVPINFLLNKLWAFRSGKSNVS